MTSLIGGFVFCGVSLLSHAPDIPDILTCTRDGLIKIIGTSHN